MSDQLKLSQPSPKGSWVSRTTINHPPSTIKRPDWRLLAVLLALFLAALGLRVWGLGWGVPDASRYYAYHPDEPVLAHAVTAVNPLWGDFKPSFYNYGTLYIFLARLGFDLSTPYLKDAAFGGAGAPGWLGDYVRLLLVGRWVTVLLGAGTVVLTVLLGRRLFSARAGWLAGLFVAMAPLAVVLSHYMTVDVPSAFFTTLALVLAAAALRSDRSPRQIWLIVGAAAVAGMAAGTKYNCFPALFPVLVPLGCLARGGKQEKRLAAVVVLGTLAAFGAAFLLSTPGAVLEPALFQKHLLEEMAHNREGQGLLFKATPPALVYHLFITLPIALEWPLDLLCLGGLAWGLYRRRPEDWLLLAFAVPFLLLLLPSERKFVRYVTPLIPVLALLAARLVDEGMAGRRRALWGGAAGVSGIAALASTVACLGVFSSGDARDRAAAYLREHAVPSTLVALGTDPWFYTPPIHPTAGATKVSVLYGGPPVWETVPPDGRQDIYTLRAYRLLAPGIGEGALPVEKLERFHPDYVVISDFEYADSLRIRQADPSYHDATTDLMDALGREYHVEADFRPRPSLPGFTWWRRGTPPIDWRYPMPEVRVYRRNG